MGAALFLGSGHALDAVHAGFGAQDVVGARGIDLEHAVRQAGFAGRDRLVSGVGEEGGRPRAAGAEAPVHVEEGRREEGRFGAAGARVQFEEAGEVGEGVGRGQAAFQRCGQLDERVGCGGDVGGGERAELRIAAWVGEEGLQFGERLYWARCPVS